MKCAAIRMLILNGHHWIILLLTFTTLVAHFSFAYAQSGECTSQEECSACERLGDIRLVRGVNVTEGRLEFCYNNTWGTVCDNGFGDADAMVACRQLGFSDQGALGIAFAMFGEGTGPIVLDDVACTGDEQQLIDCGHDGLGQHNCGHDEDVGVRCMIKSIETMSISSLLTTATVSPTLFSALVDSTSIVTSTPVISMSSSRVTFSDQITPTNNILSSTTILSGQRSPTVGFVDPSRSTDILPIPSSTQIGGQSSVTTAIPPTTEGLKIRRSTQNSGLIAGLVLFFIVLIVLVIIFILLLIICLRKRNNKETTKENNRLWYIKTNPIAEATSFEGESIFNLLEQNNGQTYGTGPRDSTPDFLVVRHNYPQFSTIPNPYNTTSALETKTVLKGTETGGVVEPLNDTLGQPNSPPPDTVGDIDPNERVTYAEMITFQRPTKQSSDSNTENKSDLQKDDWEDYDDGDYDSEWSKGSWDDVPDEMEDKETKKDLQDKGSSKDVDLTYSELQF